jgi:hypothetical protein
MLTSVPSVAPNSDLVKSAIAEQPILEDEGEAQERVLRALIRGDTDGVTFMMSDASTEVAQLVEGHGFYVTQNRTDTKAIIVDDLERSKLTG